MQHRIKSNLRSLKTSIEATRNEIDVEKEAYNNLIASTNVDWNAVLTKQNKMANLEAGLNMLKTYREQYFPNWKTILIED